MDMCRRGIVDICCAKNFEYGAARHEEKRQRFLDVVKEGIQRVGMTEENIRDIVR